MAETPGESFIFIIFAVIVIIVIVAVAGYLLLVGVNLSNSSICHVSAEFTNFYYNGLCASKFFCISGTLKTEGISPPLFGCTTATSAYSSGSKASQVFAGTSTLATSCWNEYGAQQGLTVLPNSPATCGVVNVDTNQNLTINNLTQYLEANTYTTQISCLNHTAAQSCSDPISSSNPNGFTCDVNQPSICEATSLSYFQCRDTAGYSFTPKYIPLNSTTFPNAAANMTGDLCEASQGCSFNTKLGTCANATGNTQVCTDLYTNFCSGNNCTVQYNSVVNEYSAPPSCTLTEPVKSTSIVNESYADYLRPGTNLIFSFKNLSNNKQDGFVDPNSSKSINHAQLYIVYLNSLVGTRFAPSSISLPSECEPATFLNNYPTAGIEDECSRAVVSGVAADVLAPSTSGIIAGTSLAGFTTAECYNNTICKDDIAPNAATYTKKVLYGAIAATGLEQCAQSIFYFFDSLPQEISHTKNYFLGRDVMYICAVTN